MDKTILLKGLPAELEGSVRPTLDELGLRCVNDPAQRPAVALIALDRDVTGGIQLVQALAAHGHDERPRLGTWGEMRATAPLPRLIANAATRPFNLAFPFAVAIAAIWGARWLWVVAVASYLALVTISFLDRSNQSGWRSWGEP